MNRYVVMVDAGYLLRQSIEIVSKRMSKKRAELEIPDPSALIQLLITKSKELLALDGKELLRVYWYDGVNAGGLTDQQRSLVEVDDVQFRAGTVNAAKQQKGVDSLIVTDLIELTSHHAMCDAILITGDSDLAIGIELAQRRGVRIAVLGVEDLAQGVQHHQSFEITSRADRVGRLSGQELEPLIRYVPLPTAPVIPLTKSASAIAVSAGVAAAVNMGVRPQTQAEPKQTRVVDEARIAAVVDAFIAETQPAAGVVDPATSRIQHSTDRALLHHALSQLGHGALTEPEKVFVREVFRSRLKL